MKALGPRVQLAADPVHQIIGHRQGDEDGHVIEQPHLVLVGEETGPPEAEKQEHYGRQV